MRELLNLISCISSGINICISSDTTIDISSDIDICIISSISLIFPPYFLDKNEQLPRTQPMLLNLNLTNENNCLVISKKYFFYFFSIFPSSWQMERWQTTDAEHLECVNTCDGLLYFEHNTCDGLLYFVHNTCDGQHLWVSRI